MNKLRTSDSSTCTEQWQFNNTEKNV